MAAQISLWQATMATVYSEVATDVHNTLQMHRLSIKKWQCIIKLEIMIINIHNCLNSL